MSMVRVADDTPLDPDDELLVAYLDGELDRSERTALENRLLDESPLRSRLQKLQSSWDMLEVLPDPTPNTKLVETTLELVVADIVKAKRSQTSPLARFRFPLGLIAACIVAALLAVGVNRLLQRQAYQRELRELAIAENLDAYNHAGDLDLMRQLARDADWIRMVETSRQLDELPAPRTTVASIPIDQREAAVAEMPVDVRTQLYSRWERYNRLDPTTLSKIRGLAEVVSQQTDHEKLLETMRAYAVWRESLPPETVDVIEGPAGKERDVAIDEAIKRSMVAISERSSRKLSDDAIESIYFVLRQILEDRLEALPAEVRAKFAEAKEHSGGGRRGSLDPEWMGLNYLFGPREYRRRDNPQPPFLGKRNDPLRRDELEWIRLVLAPEDLATLDKSTDGGDPLLEAMTIKTWAEEAIRRKAPWNRHDETPALQRYLELPTDRRDEFDLLPPKEMIDELNRPWGRYSG